MVKKLTPTQANISERRDKVAQLMLAHRSVNEMANVLDVKPATIYKDIKAIREHWAIKRADAYERYIAEDLERLEALERALWPDAMRGKWLVIDRVLAIMDRRMRLIGHEAPQKAIVTVLTPEIIQSAISERQTKIAALMQAAQVAGLEVDDPPTIDAVVVAKEDQ